MGLSKSYALDKDVFQGVPEVDRSLITQFFCVYAVYTSTMVFFLKKTFRLDICDNLISHTFLSIDILSIFWSLVMAILLSKFVNRTSDFEYYVFSMK